MEAHGNLGSTETIIVTDKSDHIIEDFQDENRNSIVTEGKYTFI